jgi:hypothetical protein
VALSIDEKEIAREKGCEAKGFKVEVLTLWSKSMGMGITWACSV